MKTNMEELARLVAQGTTTKDQSIKEKQLWNALDPGEKRQTTESVAFASFAGSTLLLPDPFDHSNEDPPRPDICTEIRGGKYYFELGEITDENLAKSISDPIRARTVSGCALSQIDPLGKMLDQKCRKRYETSGAPVDLLLYYWRQSPYEPVIEDYISENRTEIDRAFKNSGFQNIWIYDMESERVLWRGQR